uniref:Glial cell line derived neurotrophic factor family receptor alpha 4 n=1 Tax=Jaculus jaculus TaxID=51337 RepID=A0A8C5LM72_JACJA
MRQDVRPKHLRDQDQEQELLEGPLPGSAGSAGRNRCVDAAEACSADARCQQLRTRYVTRCLGRAVAGGCSRARCHHALRRFFSRGPPKLTLALLFCPCAEPACAERRRQTFVPSCAFSEPEAAPPCCLASVDLCERSPVCRPRAACTPTPASWVRTASGLLGVPAGTAVTPNYVDNTSARVAPWCDCGASGNRHEECEAFRGLFTRNRCLDGAIQAFGSKWPPILQNAGRSFQQVGVGGG